MALAQEILLVLIVVKDILRTGKAAERFAIAILLQMIESAPDTLIAVGVEGSFRVRVQVIN